MKIENDLNKRHNEGKAIFCITTVLEIGVRELARNLNYSPSYISQILSGSRKITDKLFKELAQEFNLSLEFIKSVISYYSSLSDEYDSLSKDQFTMLYVLESTSCDVNKASLNYNPKFRDEYEKNINFGNYTIK